MWKNVMKCGKVYGKLSQKYEKLWTVISFVKIFEHPIYSIGFIFSAEYYSPSPSSGYNWTNNV